jgi:hypothetical protein
MVWEPAVGDENPYVAEPPARAREEVTVVPSTAMDRVPVGVVVLELEADATLMLIASVAPEAGVVVAAESAVVVASAVVPTVNVRLPVEVAYVESPE